MRIALDSSVLIAAHISRAGVCSELVEDVLLRHELVVSEFILGEVARKLVEKFHYSSSDAAENVAALRRACILAEPSEVPADLCRDPDDLPVLGTAVGGGCALLVSVDRDLLDMGAVEGAVEGIPIIRPGEYWARAREAE